MSNAVFLAIGLAVAAICLFAFALTLNMTDDPADEYDAAPFAVWPDTLRREGPSARGIHREEDVRAKS